MFQKKLIKKLQDSVDELTNIVKTNELNRLRQESQELKLTKELLSKVHLRVKDVRIFEAEDIRGDYLKIKYSIPDIELCFDEKGETIHNDTFYAINMLNLIPLEDMNKIKKVLNEKKLLDNSKNS